MSGRQIRETLAALGVIASMVFVGLEIRQNAEATRTATVLQLKDNWVQLNLTQIENPDLAEAVDLAASEGLESIDRRSRMQVFALHRVLMHNWSNAYFQFRMGTLSSEQWQPLLRDAEAESVQRVTWEVWEEISHIWDDPFRNLMDSLRTANFQAAP